MTPGAAGGRTPLVAPTPRSTPQLTVVQAGTEAGCPGWSMAGAVAVVADGDTPRWKVLEPFLVPSLYATLATAGSSSTVCTAYLNGVSIGTVTLAASDDDEADAITPVRAVPGDRIHMRPTTAGTGAKGLYMNFNFIR